jgi:hypothetical protein
MQKLQELKKKQQQQQQQATAAPKVEETTTTAKDAKTEATTTDGQGFVLKRQNSKELAEKRKQKETEGDSLFTLRRSGSKKDKQKKQSPGELRVQKGIYLFSYFSRFI